MKDLLASFFLCLIISYILVVVSVNWSGWGLIFAMAFVLAVALSAFLGQSKRIDALEQRIRELEREKKEP